MSEGCNEPDAPLPSLSWPLSRCGDGRRRERVDVSFPVRRVDENISRARIFPSQPARNRTAAKQRETRRVGVPWTFGDRVRTVSRPTTVELTRRDRRTRPRRRRIAVDARVPGFGSVGTFRALCLVVVREQRLTFFAPSPCARKRALLRSVAQTVTLDLARLASGVQPGDDCSDDVRRLLLALHPPEG